jgi:germination protein M
MDVERKRFFNWRIPIYIAVILGIIIIGSIKTKKVWLDYREVRVYFADDLGMGLLPEIRYLYVDSQDELYTAIINELIKGPYTLNLTIPPGTKLLNCNLQGDILVVNFSKELQINHWGGSAGEILTVYSIVNSLTELPEVKAVQILIEGEVQESLAGHLEIYYPISRDDSLILSGPV